MIAGLVVIVFVTLMYVAALFWIDHRLFAPKVKCCLWFRHNYVWVGEEEYTLPSRGPFDPNPNRTDMRRKYICCKCGKFKYRPPKTYCGFDVMP